MDTDLDKVLAILNTSTNWSWCQSEPDISNFISINACAKHVRLNKGASKWVILTKFGRLLVEFGSDDLNAPNHFPTTWEYFLDNFNQLFWVRTKALPSHDPTVWWTPCERDTWIHLKGTSNFKASKTVGVQTQSSPKFLTKSHWTDLINADVKIAMLWRDRYKRGNETLHLHSPLQIGIYHFMLIFHFIVIYHFIFIHHYK